MMVINTPSVGGFFHLQTAYCWPAKDMGLVALRQYSWRLLLGSYNVGAALQIPPALVPLDPSQGVEKEKLHEHNLSKLLMVQKSCTTWNEPNLAKIRG